MFDTTQVLYDRLIQYGVAKECARGILPLNTPTKLYMAGSIRSWIHYIQLRSGNGTQEEHRRIAVACGRRGEVERETAALEGVPIAHCKAR